MRQPELKVYRQCMSISLVITIISLILLGTYRPESLIQLSTKYYRPTNQSKTHVPFQLPEQCGPGRIVPQGQELSLVTVNGTKTLLVSAYQEHRTAKKEVRVIAVVLRSENVDYSCLLCCQDKLHVSKGVSDVHSDHFGFAYGTADIMCPVPSGCESISHITVISAAANSEDERHEFMEVKNKKIRNELFSYNFTVCLSTMFDFTNVLQLVQSLEMLQLLGVNRVAIYFTNCSPEIQLILDHFSQKGLVELIPWSWSRYLNVSRGWLPIDDPGDLHYYGQVPALNDCVYRYMYQSRYVAMHDIDELILPQSVSSWTELLPMLEKKFGPDKGYMFVNNVFPTTVTNPTTHVWQNVTGVNILAYLYREPFLKKTKYMNFKVIVNPRAVFSTSIHGLLKSKHGQSWIDRNIAQMYHTRPAKQTNLTLEDLIYDGRLLSYSERLIPAVNTVLRECGLLPVVSTD
ncbi:uncharacterized protein LOC113171441 [Anabas testudineus]|uniref:Glycosyltransferase family 92 protein n=1 Tax=Anabas testudineus TaxID=64144 RepID=A0A3Q1IL37_ANATE|nr:uncharacterized protein LOC113171441 [Anabas testudineus]XP_026229585.1 uncharacterized protein LOC113171441 [Anabas testudineus]XP_026229593.1 uncharacterized protein LOC113171441 [Anabas testudineus]XP_026229602.1 uncharacterized protein LOC113171441 [Anabas testudineus]XP_026229611.1 uncharacterized protein LOC113171441 [Anabas testudineus]